LTGDDRGPLGRPA